MTLKDPIPRFQGQAIFLTLNISKMAMAADTAIVTMEGVYTLYINVTLLERYWSAYLQPFPSKK